MSIFYCLVVWIMEELSLIAYWDFTCSQSRNAYKHAHVTVYNTHITCKITDKDLTI